MASDVLCLLFSDTARIPLVSSRREETFFTNRIVSVQHQKILSSCIWNRNRTSRPWYQHLRIAGCGKIIVYKKYSFYAYLIELTPKKTRNRKNQEVMGKKIHRCDHNLPFQARTDDIEAQICRPQLDWVFAHTWRDWTLQKVRMSLTSD